MTTTSRHDAWQAGDSYDAYMGRWSRPIAEAFLGWLAMPAGLDWLEVGCGTGALTEAIVRKGEPSTVLAIDPSAEFITKARQAVGDARVAFQVADAASLASVPAASRDVAVAALVLNFIPDRLDLLRDLRRILRPGGTIGFYVWDYPGGGVGFMRAFWDAAVALDPAAGDLTEDRRFPFCTPEGLTDLARQAGLPSPVWTKLEAPTRFADFDDYWKPFTLGAGPAPGYCASLSPAAREQLRQSLSESLPRQADGSIHLSTRAWAIKATVA